MKNLISFLIFMCFTNIFAQEPNWDWAISLGGDANDHGYGLCVDIENNVIITGYFSETAAFETFNITSTGDLDIFVAKFNQDSECLWVTQAGGAIYQDKGTAITSDESGNIYITGYFEGTVSFGSYQVTSAGAEDFFVAKLDSEGNWLWVKTAGGSASDFGRHINCDSNGNILVTGMFTATAHFGETTLVSNGAQDIFVGKISSDGDWSWVKSAGGNFNDYGRGVSTDNYDNVYVTGFYGGIITFGEDQLTSEGQLDMFIAKLSSNGEWDWVKSAGSSTGSDKSVAISNDSEGNAVISGWFMGTCNFDEHVLSSNGAEDIFSAKISTNGEWIWVNKAGSMSNDNARAISLDDNGNTYICGYIENDATFGSHSINCDGSGDIFVGCLNSTGNWDWVKRAGGNGWEAALAIDIDNSSNIFVTGYNIDPTIIGENNLLHYGNDDIFLAKLLPETDIEDTYTTNTFDTKLKNYPNPFNPSTIIEFDLIQDSQTNLSIYNIIGEKIKTLVNQRCTKGINKVIWNGANKKDNQVSSGIYFIKLTTEYDVITKKIIIFE